MNSTNNLSKLICLLNALKEIAAQKADLGSPEKVKRSAPRIILNNTEEFKNNYETKTELSDNTTYNSLVMYRKYEGDLKIAMAKGLMVLLDKYKEKKREKATKATHKTAMGMKIYFDNPDQHK